MRVEDLLQELVRRFDESPATAGKAMRDLLAADAESFLRAAPAALNQAAGGAGYRCLIGLLASQGLLRRCLCATSLSLPRAVAATRIGMQTDPTLARDLMQDCMRNGTRQSDEAVRRLEILGEIVPAERLAPLLARFLHHPDARIRSEAALRIGRGNREQAWQRYASQADPRARANLIESLWGLEGEDPLGVLLEASRDSNNRVAGNARIGLRRLGDVRSIPLTLQMAEHSDPLFRATAAWVMGESADPRFLKALGRMLVDGDSRVRSRAFLAFSTVRGLAERHETLRVHIAEASISADHLRRLRVSVVDAEGNPPPLAATDFAVSEAGQPVLDYEVERLPSAVLAAGFAIPNGWEGALPPLKQALLACLARKQANDAWGILPYAEAVGSEARAGASDPFHFTTRTAALQDLIGRLPARSGVSSGWIESAGRLLAGAGLVSGERHLMLVPASDARGLEAQAEAISADAREHQVAVDLLVIAGGQTPALAGVCKSTGGRLIEVDAPERLGEALSGLYWGWQCGHEIRYRLEDSQVTPPGPMIKVQVCSETGIGEDELVPE